jgi:hypothetical protein
MFSVAKSFRPYTHALMGGIGLALIAAASSQPAQAVSLTFTSTDAPGVCPIGSCHYDVITTSDVPPSAGPFPGAAITYPTLTSLNLNGYSFNYVDAATAAAFATGYNASAANPILKTANSGGASLAQPPTGGQAGGPLFFTAVSTIGTGNNKLNIANGQIFGITAQAAINFTSNISGTGAFASVKPQPQVWSIFKCTSGGCAPQPPVTSVPAPLPILGIGATFAYSRRMRQRIAAHQG